jgi:hypothetical protein
VKSYEIILIDNKLHKLMSNNQKPMSRTSVVHILCIQKGMYSIFEYKTNFEREAFRFSKS